jgi:response regulator RpfG family c-di-GMP phosphodiesterase
MNTVSIQDRNAEIREVLESDGYNIISFEHCGPDLYSSIVNVHPAAVILEYNFNKHLVTEMIKNIKVLMKYIPVIGLMIDTFYSSAVKSFGFDDLIMKPFNIDSLLQTTFNNIKLYESGELVLGRS